MTPCLINITEYIRKSRNLRLGGDIFKRVVYFTNSFFEGDLFKKGDIFKRVVISRAYGSYSCHYEYQTMYYLEQKAMANHTSKAMRHA